MKHSEQIELVSQKLGYHSPPTSVKPCSGGCIHNTTFWEFKDGERFFVKHAQSIEGEKMLSTEEKALRLIHESKSVRCPEPLFGLAIPGDGYVFVMEYLELEGLSRESGAQLGADLATLHETTAEEFGINFDNYIGATPQYNRKNKNWAEFFWTERIQFQLSLAAKRGYSFEKVLVLEKAIFKILEGHSPQSSLLHGDLWGGNAGALPNGTPVIFDPASYFGDYETDIAFTEVFGGFPGTFYEGYKAAKAIDEGYAVRKWIYNLYHYLNHLNLFGSGYLSSCENNIQQIIKNG